MSTYVATVQIEFTDEDLDAFNEDGIDSPLDPYEAVNAVLDNLGLGQAWIDKLYADGRPMITEVWDED